MTRVDLWSKSDKFRIDGKRYLLESSNHILFRYNFSKI